MLFNGDRIKNYLAAVAYLCTGAYLIINPVVSNHDKIMSFGVLHLGILFFMTIKDGLANEAQKGKVNGSNNSKINAP